MARPILAAAAITARRQAAGFTPPAFVTTRTFFWISRSSVCSICAMKSRANPISGARARCFCMIDIVISARKSSVR